MKSKQSSAKDNFCRIGIYLTRANGHASNNAMTEFPSPGYCTIAEKLTYSKDISLAIEDCDGLEKLSLRGYSLDDRPSLGLANENTLRLSSLSMTDLSFLRPDLAPSLITISSLTLRLPGSVTQSFDQIEQFRSFLVHCLHLAHLDIQGVFDLFDEELLAALGKSLVSFRVEDMRTFPGIDACLSPQMIARYCLKLQRLGIDIGYGTWMDWVGSAERTR